MLILNSIRIKKSDKSEVLSYKKIADIIEARKKLQGDVYDKAVFLLKNLVQKHPFASGNRRTAFITTKDFILQNHFKFAIKGGPEYANIMTGIRENYYTDLEIKEWIKNGEIQKFKR